MRKSHIFSARRITQIRNHLSAALFANASAARDRHASARRRATPESNVFAHPLDLSPVLQGTNGLLLKTGYRIRGCIFHEDRNGNGLLWAVKIGKGNNKSHHLVRIPRPDLGLVFPALRPDNACTEIMEAITGNFSP